MIWTSDSNDSPNPCIHLLCQYNTSFLYFTILLNLPQSTSSLYPLSSKAALSTYSSGGLSEKAYLLLTNSTLLKIYPKLDPPPSSPLLIKQIFINISSVLIAFIIALIIPSTGTLKLRAANLNLKVLNLCYYQNASYILLTDFFEINILSKLSSKLSNFSNLGNTLTIDLIEFSSILES